MTSATIPGYAYGTSAVPRSPVTVQDLDLLKQTALLTDDDIAALRMSRPVLEDQVDAILDVWYGFVGSHPHLLHFFTGRADGQPIGDYLAAARARFGQWILDTAAANYNQTWLDYQDEIGHRHHRTGKNRTDGVDSVPNISYRYLPTLIVPIVMTLKPFLVNKGHSAEDVERMHQAWLKSVILQVTLWSRPYVKDGDF
ncbi:MAG: protoglobin domain-containing protein [Dehalococcoidia bacterium]